jgi:hypothetical protein
VNYRRQRLVGTLVKELRHRRSTPRIREGEAWGTGKSYATYITLRKEGLHVKTHVPVYVFVRETRRRVMSLFHNLVIARSLFRSSAIHVTLLSMPPKRAASSNKRKAESDSDGEKPVGSKKTTKQAKVDALAEDTGLAPNGQPTNKVLPVKISFPPRSERTTRIASWNICSLASSQKKVCFDAVILELAEHRRLRFRVSSTMWRRRTQIS